MRPCYHPRSPLPTWGGCRRHRGWAAGARGRWRCSLAPAHNRRESIQRRACVQHQLREAAGNACICQRGSHRGHVVLRPPAALLRPLLLERLHGGSLSGLANRAPKGAVSVCACAVDGCVRDTGSRAHLGLEGWGGSTLEGTRYTGHTFTVGAASPLSTGPRAGLGPRLAVLAPFPFFIRVGVRVRGSTLAGRPNNGSRSIFLSSANMTRANCSTGGETHDQRTGGI